MNRLSTSTRIAISLVLLTVSILMLAEMLGLISNSDTEIVQNRIRLCETITVQLATTIENNQVEKIDPLLSAIVDRNPGMISIIVRDVNGKILAGNPLGKDLLESRSEASTPSHIVFPIFLNKDYWGRVEFSFNPLKRAGILSYLALPYFRLLLFVAGLGFITYGVYLRRVLRYLDPSSVIPERVKSMLDILVEGVIVLDNQERIVLANNAFLQITGYSNLELQGRKATEIGWKILMQKKKTWIFLGSSHFGMHLFKKITSSNLFTKPKEIEF